MSADPDLHIDFGDCTSCPEAMPEGECPKSLRPCGHHCNHSWDQDHCHWCGVEFGEDGIEVWPEPILVPAPESPVRTEANDGHCLDHGPFLTEQGCYGCAAPDTSNDPTANLGDLITVPPLRINLLADLMAWVLAADHHPGCSASSGYYPCKCGLADLLERIDVGLTIVQARQEGLLPVDLGDTDG